MSDRVNRRGWIVVESVASDDGARCVDFFEDPAGGVGFELFRSDPEDAGRWTPSGGFAGARFGSFHEATTQAEKSVSWLTAHRGAKQALARWRATWDRSDSDADATNAILMRPFRTDDSAALLGVYRQSDDLVRQTGELASIADAEALIDKYLAAGRDQTGQVWAITDRGRLVGCVGVTNVETRHRTGWCWYWIGARDRGRGLATRALVTAAVWAFETGVFRLELGHRLDNPASCAVATKAGFIPEGIERAKLEYDGERFDCETHARLATDPTPPIEPITVVA